MATLRRTFPKPGSGATLPLPPDVRLMNFVSGTVFVIAAVGALVAGFLWLMRSPLFPIKGIQLDGELARNSVPTIRANAAPRLAGNFFSIDLQQGREAFESVPWVRAAVVRRVWPDRLAVRLEEHRAAALWAGEDVADGVANRLVNSHGEVFDANIGDLDDDSLPTLEGPDGTSAQMLILLGRLQQALAPAQMVIERLHLSGRGSWRAELVGGATLELGRGTEEEVVARTERFVRTLPQATARWSAPLESADLRHRDGYAVRLRDYRPASAAASNPTGQPPAASAAAKTN
ncbi:MAG: cell division protein FtsQ/DivIB [Rubrivivax sp.]|nr:cell division protein FtsQ/DivIB [Rubrivivax sp.]MDP3614197.1 cell division protein FtsQ/DivIB [Rubrivivax sp.]